MSNLRITGWSAYISGIATVLTLLTGVLFFTIGQSFGKINDTSSVIQVLFMIPLAIGLYRLLPSNARVLGFFAAAVGVAGMLISGAGVGYIVTVVGFLWGGQRKVYCRLAHSSAGGKSAEGRGTRLYSPR